MLASRHASKNQQASSRGARLQGVVVQRVVAVGQRGVHGTGGRPAAGGRHAGKQQPGRGVSRGHDWRAGMSRRVASPRVHAPACNLLLDMPPKP